MYQSIIGYLNYIGVASRPDISHAVTHLSQFLKEPREHDYQQAMRVLTYLRDHMQRCSIYKKMKTQSFHLRTYVDSSYMNANDRRSIYGYVIFLNNNVLHWRSKINNLTALSTTEAEFVAAAISIQTLNWIYQIMSELCLHIQTSVVFVDNQGAVRILNSESSSSRMRHVDVRLQYAKSFVLNGRHTIRFVQTKDQVVDVFTKPL